MAFLNEEEQKAEAETEGKIDLGSSDNDVAAEISPIPDTVGVYPASTTKSKKFKTSKDPGSGKKSSK